MYSSVTGLWRLLSRSGLPVSRLRSRGERVLIFIDWVSGRSCAWSPAQKSRVRAVVLIPKAFKAVFSRPYTYATGFGLAMTFAAGFWCLFPGAMVGDTPRGYPLLRYLFSAR